MCPSLSNLHFRLHNVQNCIFLNHSPSSLTDGGVGCGEYNFHPLGSELTVLCRIWVGGAGVGSLFVCLLTVDGELLNRLNSARRKRKIL